MATTNGASATPAVTLRHVDSPFSRDECFLPAATAQCHASNLLLLANGDLLCAWFGGSQEGKPDISIYFSRLPSDADTWSAARRVTFDETRSEQNPVLFQASSSELWLLYTSQRAGDQDSAVVKRQISADGGETWSASDILFPEPGTFIRQPVVTLKNDDLVLPTFKCRVEPGKRWIGNDDISVVRVSSDQGMTWKEVEVPASFGAVHMQIRRLPDGTYFSLFRSRWADHIYSSTSPDGVDWAPPQPTQLPNPNSGIAFSVLPDGRLLTVYNHSSKIDATGRREGLYDDVKEAGDERNNQSAKHGGREAFWGAPRAPLCLAWSDDRGRTWQHRTLEEGDGYCMTNDSEQKLNRELSYPSMAVGGDGTVHITFTFWRQRIKYIRLMVDALQ